MELNLKSMATLTLEYMAHENQKYSEQAQKIKMITDLTIDELIEHLTDGTYGPISKTEIKQNQEDGLKALTNLEYNRKVKVPAMIDLLIGDYWANHMQGHTTQDQLLNIIIEDWRIGFNTDEYWNEGIWIENNFCKFVDAVRCGHEVEEEPKWVIPLPSLKTSDGKQQFLSHDPHKDTYFASRKSVMVKQNFNKIELEDVPEQFKSYATPLVQL